jgi:hypothetical protein
MVISHTIGILHIAFFLKIDFVNHGSSLINCHEIDNFPKFSLSKCL